jgi:hypothetical protein
MGLFIREEYKEPLELIPYNLEFVMFQNAYMAFN